MSGSADQPRALIRLDSSCPTNRSWSTPLRGATRVLRCETDGRAALFERGRRICDWGGPLEALSWLESQARAEPGCRWIGYLGYDLGRWFEDLPTRAVDDLRVPLFVFANFNEREGEAPAELHPPGHLPPDRSLALTRSNFTRDGYLAAVSRAIEYIRAGDIFQANLSQRFTAERSGEPLEVYHRLLASTPAWYGAYLDFGDFALLSNSPELFLQVSRDPPTGKRRVVTRPIKGTRPRLPGMNDELLRSAKDQAELNMIVDLERNDLGRVCEIGSVRVTEPRTIEAHPTVYHGAATVEGLLREDVGLVDLLRATFPGGSITGAPKIRAMQIIDELEPVRRGPYCGAIGYVAADHIEFNMAIRTMIVQGSQVHIPVGGGIVADSDPAAEFEETLVKASAMFAALGPARK